jgi:hypothetical protein
VEECTYFWGVNTSWGINTAERKDLCIRKIIRLHNQHLGHTINNGKLTLQNHAVEFADKFPDKITDKTQLQRFLGSLNYTIHFYRKCAQDRKILNDRLKKDPSPWTEAHSQAVRNIKAKAKNLPILYISDDDLFKIVEKDASNIGWGAILK